MALLLYLATEIGLWLVIRARRGDLGNFRGFLGGLPLAATDGAQLVVVREQAAAARAD
jgi:hypothetical protein